MCFVFSDIFVVSGVNVINRCILQTMYKLFSFFFPAKSSYNLEVKKHPGQAPNFPEHRQYNPQKTT